MNTNGRVIQSERDVKGGRLVQIEDRMAERNVPARQSRRFQIRPPCSLLFQFE